MNKNIKELISLHKKLMEDYRTQAQAAFKEYVKEFFEKNPGINAFIWSQYTPYFNDGDECKFSVNEPWFTNAKDDELSEVSCYGEYYGDNEEVFVIDRYDAQRSAQEGTNNNYIIKLEEIITAPEMTEVMEAMFGDHVEVTATRNGFEIKGHSHD